MRTARAVAVEEAAFFTVLKPGTCVALSYVSDPDVWRVAHVTWPSLGVDRAASILAPDDDHHVGLMAGANAGLLWMTRVVTVPLFPMAVSVGSDRGPGAKNSFVSWRLLEGEGHRPWDVSFWTQKGQRSFPRANDRGGPTTGVAI